MDLFLSWGYFLQGSFFYADPNTDVLRRWEVGVPPPPNLTPPNEWIYFIYSVYLYLFKKCVSKSSFLIINNISI